MSERQFEIVKETTPYKGFFSLRKLEIKHTLYQGGWSPTLTRELFHRGNCVAVLLYDPKRDEVVMIEQFRVGAIQMADKAWLIEIVAGAIEEGETAEDVAYRESIEEANCQIEELIKINDFFTSPGGTSELLSLYCGKVNSESAGGFHGLDHENEDIAVTSIKFDALYQKLLNGGVISAIPIIAIQWLFINREQLRKKWLA